MPRRVHEETVAYIHGIDSKGDIVYVLVHKKGERVRFSGMLGDHNVSVPNRADLEKWMHEAEAVWSLDEVVGIPRGLNSAPAILEKLEIQKAKAAKRKSELAASGASSV